MNDNAKATASHRRFVEEIVNTGKVWGLKTAEGWANTPSAVYEDAHVLPFWSDMELAQAVAIEDWADYKPQAINLVEFLENWLIGMDDDGTIAGTNWDTDMVGTETEPLELALQIVQRLRVTKQFVRLKNFKDLNDYDRQIKDALSMP